MCLLLVYLLVLTLELRETAKRPFICLASLSSILAKFDPQLGKSRGDSVILRVILCTATLCIHYTYPTEIYFLFQFFSVEYGVARISDDRICMM